MNDRPTNGRPTNGTALAEAVVFLQHFDDLHDPCQSGKVTYPLDEILLLCLLAVLLALQVEYAEWLEALPENLHDSPRPTPSKLSSHSTSTPWPIPIRHEDMDATEKNVTNDQSFLASYNPNQRNLLPG